MQVEMQLFEQKNMNINLLICAKITILEQF